MKPAAFDYIACVQTDEALECLTRYGEDARLLAGGQSLIAMLNMRLLEPRVIADISRIEALSAINEIGEQIRIGAGVTQSDLLRWPNLQKKVPLLASTLPHVGHFQTRNKGTVCGSLAHADPSSELPLAACVLDATIELQSERGRRTIAARDFFAGLLQTNRKTDEMIIAVVFQARQKLTGFAFKEIAMRHGDFAIVAIAVEISDSSITIGIGGGAEQPEWRTWPRLVDLDIDDALNALAWEISFQDDLQASAKYRRRIVRKLGREAIDEAIACLN